ncbi:type II toxin-antitoxin system VapC family toxin [Haladaptatus cibarius]|uniref:type II toxin-antitoxin system VapC family toxin n=1 Tax=Haladaptatus cibarius TaxID=453847 RepID=UPI000679B7EB|nr:type II toxin-antitoxin system VapC family toxin [Haladaptatus cibarius]
MNCLDSSFLIDYLNGQPDAQEYMETNPTSSFYSPSLVLFELYDGLDEHTDRSLDEFDAALDWITPMPFTVASSREAIKIKRELKANGMPVNLKDVLIAGTVREAGGTIVTRDDDFKHVAGLSVRNY